MPPAYPKAARRVAVALRAQGIYPKEIARRLNADQAGLGFPVPVSERTVKDWLGVYKRDNGPFGEPAAADVDADSINQLKVRALALIRRDLHKLEKQPAGRLSVEQSKALRQHFETLDSMERISERAATRRRQPSRAKRAGADAEPKKPKSALEQLAETMGEEKAAQPDPPPTQAIGEKQGSVLCGAGGPDEGLGLERDGGRAEPRIEHGQSISPSC